VFACFNFLTTQFLHCADLSAGSALTLLLQQQPAAALNMILSQSGADWFAS
jgi:hypothetical protein